MSGIRAEGYCSRFEEWEPLTPVDTETEKHGVIGLCPSCMEDARELAGGSESSDV